MDNKEELYFKNDVEWRAWLLDNHTISRGVYLIFYTVKSTQDSMRWEEAVQVALCYGWIDSTVKKMDEQRRKQLFTPRKSKSVWSKLNKSYIEKLTKEKLIHKSGLEIIEMAKQNGSWESLDDVENLCVPIDLQTAFDHDKQAYENYKKFSPSYRKSYLYWLNQAKKKETRDSRINQIISLCFQNKKTRP